MRRGYAEEGRIRSLMEEQSARSAGLRIATCLMSQMVGLRWLAEVRATEEQDLEEEDSLMRNLLLRTM